MSHICEPRLRSSWYCFTWFTRWVRKPEGWWLYKICDRCASNPNCSPQVVLSLNSEERGFNQHIDHVVYQASNNTPMGQPQGRFYALEIGIVDNHRWEVVSMKEITDPRLIQRLDDELAKKYGLTLV